MLLTEEEAIKKWCPQAQDESEGGSYNRFEKAESPTFPIACTCIASKCMWWRWENNLIPRVTASKDNPPQDEGWKMVLLGNNDIEWIKYLPETRRGYCGIVGRAISQP